MSYEVQYVEPFVAVRLERGKTVGQAFEEGKAAALRALDRERCQIQELTFDRYARELLPPGTHDPDHIW